MIRWKSSLRYWGLIVIEILGILIVLCCIGKLMWRIRNLYRISKTKSLSVLMPFSGQTFKTTANLSSLVKWDMLLVEAPYYSVVEPSWECITLVLSKPLSKLTVCRRSSQAAVREASLHQFWPPDPFRTSLMEKSSTSQPLPTRKNTLFGENSKGSENKATSWTSES